ncbi:hypothetical protein ABH920_005299 [Catenulispora sp. EB89]|uniref:hypothetical protein n=1 Tax=Catenulispora sp. EB89 TaxID=3156257 RepID=UPI003516813B
MSTPARTTTTESPKRRMPGSAAFTSRNTGWLQTSSTTIDPAHSGSPLTRNRASHPAWPQRIRRFSRVVGTRSRYSRRSSRVHQVCLTPGVVLAPPPNRQVALLIRRPAVTSMG